MTLTSPTGEPATPELVPVALRAMLASVLLGVGATAAVLWVVRTIQSAAPAATPPSPTGLVANLVLLGWLGGAAVTGLLGWRLMRPLASAYRRGGLSMVAGFTTMVLALVAMPADALWGRAGLLALAAVCAGGGVLLSWQMLTRRA